MHVFRALRCRLAGYNLLPATADLMDTLKSLFGALLEKGEGDISEMGESCEKDVCEVDCDRMAGGACVAVSATSSLL